MKKLLFLLFLVLGSATYSQSVTGSEVSQLLYKEVKTVDASSGSSATVISNAFYGTVEVTSASVSDGGVFALTVSNSNCNANSVVVVTLEMGDIDPNAFSASCLVYNKTSSGFTVAIKLGSGSVLTEQTIKVNYVLR